MVQRPFPSVVRNVYPPAGASTSALDILRNAVRNTFRMVTPGSRLIDFVNSAKAAGDVAVHQLSDLPWQDAFEAVRSRLSGKSTSGGSTSGGSSSGRSTSGGSSSGGSSAVVPPAAASSQPETFDYLDAPWASAYKMSRETAYSEALHNTSYQRAVKDMMRAGLNPAVIFGAGNGNPAGVPGFASSYVPPASSSRASSGHGSGSGRSKSSDKLFSSSAYSVMSSLGGIVGALATKSAGGYWIGTSLTQGAMSALSLLSKASQKR